MKNSSIIFCVMIAFLLSACSKKIIYISPEIHGKVYDNIQKKPIHKNSRIGFEGLMPDNAPSIMLKDDGGFVLPAVTETYFFLRPNVRKYDLILPKIYVGADNYQYKIIDYAPFYSEQVDEEKSGFSYLTKLDVGIIYLEPEK